MKIPKKLKILGHNYTIRELPGLADDGNIDGSFITIKKELPQSHKEETLFHEILHAVNSELSEKDVEFLAQTLYQVFKDNDLLI